MSEVNDGNGTGEFGFTSEDSESEVDLPEGEPGELEVLEVLEGELRRAVGILDPVPAELRQLAVAAYALHDLDVRHAELTFDSLLDALPVRGASDSPRMLTFQSGETTVDVEVTAEGLMGQVLPPRQVTVEVLSGPAAGTSLLADDLGRFVSQVAPTGPFALRLRSGGEVVVTEWVRA